VRVTGQPARGLARLGILAVGLGIGATVASTPGIALADSLDFQISIDGNDLLPTADNSAWWADLLALF
jgi:hypothetical protein